MSRRRRTVRRTRGRRASLGGALLAALVVVALALAGVEALDRPPVRDAPVSGRIEVIDADTVRMADGERVRIANLDAPELPPRARCDYERRIALAGKQRLAVLVASAQEVTFVPDRRERDRYGRLLGRIELDGQDVGETLIAEGLARPWRGRSSDWCAP